MDVAKGRASAAAARESMSLLCSKVSNYTTSNLPDPCGHLSIKVPLSSIESVNEPTSDVTPDFMTATANGLLWRPTSPTQGGSSSIAA